MSSTSTRLLALTLATTLATTSGCTIAASKHRGLGFVADDGDAVGATVTMTGLGLNSADGDGHETPIVGGLAIIGVGAFLGLLALEAWGPPAPPVASGSRRVVAPRR